MPWKPRAHARRFRELLKAFPVVCILGPRQCGKTTFVKSVLPRWRYLDMEKPSDLAQVGDDPETQLRRWREKIVFDEAQRLPRLFPVLRSFIDENPKGKGRIVLLGSASFDIIQGVSESLAGRVGFLDMTPFQIVEAPRWKRLWFRGGFPDAYLEQDDRRRLDWFEGYARTFLERDLRQLGLDVSPTQMRRLWSMLAHLQGELWNASELGGSLGTSYHTVNRYVDILEQTFLVRRLKPYHANIGKRLTKSPRVYIRDSGLLHYFLGIHRDEDLDVHPKRGKSWEGFVIEQIADFASLHSPGTEFFFWRTATGQEVDLIVKLGGRLVPVEIKTHRSPQKSDLKGLHFCMGDLQLAEGYVVRPEGEEYSLGDGMVVLNLREFLSRLAKKHRKVPSQG
jgi:hypothetical protein